MLHDVLARSDESMRVVRDLFGDDPKRYTCQPNVTAAPSLKQKLKAELNSRETVLQLTQQSCSGPGENTAVSALDSPGGIWDDSVREIFARKKPALNDSTLLHGRSEEVGLASPSGIEGGAKSARVADLSSIDVSTSELPPSASGDYKPQVDLRRFQQLLEQEEKIPNSGGTGPTNIPLRGQAGGLPSATVPNNAPLAKEPLGPRNSGGIRLAVPSDDAGHVAESEYHQESAWCDDSVHSGRGRGGMALGEGSVHPPSASAEASEISAFPLGSSVRRNEDASGVELGVGRGSGRSGEFPRKPPTGLKGKRVDEAGSNGTGMVEVGQRTVGEELEEEGDEGTLVSQNTSKIHADLSRLELLVRDLDHKLEMSKKFLPSSEPPKAQTRSQQQSSASSQPWKLPGSDVDVVSLLSRVSGQLEKSDRQLDGEMMLRGQFLQTLSDQQDLLDALATDLLKVQRENTGLRQDMVQIRVQNAEEVSKLKGELANLRSALFLLLQQTPAHPLHSTSASPHSSQDLQHGVQSVTSQMTQDLMAQLSQAGAPPISSTHSTTSAQVEISKMPSTANDTIVSSTINGQVYSKAEPALSQSWVELTPRLDYVPSTKQMKHSFSNDKMTPPATSGRPQDRVVYAHVSPLSYSEHSVSGKELHLTGSRSSPSVSTVSKLPVSRDSLGTSSSASHLEHVTSSHTTIYAPRPPPISMAVLSPTIPQSSLANATSHARTSVNKHTQNTPTQISARMDLPARSSNDSTNSAAKSAKISEFATNHDHLPEALPSRVQTPGSSDNNSQSHCNIPLGRPAQIRQDLTRSSADTGFDVAGLLQSLQQLEKFRMEEAASQTKPLQDGAATRGVKELTTAGGGIERRPVHGMDSSQSSKQDSIAQTNTLSNTSQDHNRLQQLSVTRSSGLLLAPPTQQYGANGEAGATRENYKALTPITEEGSVLTSSFIVEDSNDRGLPEATGLVRNDNVAPLHPVRQIAGVDTKEKTSSDDLKVSKSFQPAGSGTTTLQKHNSGLSSSGAEAVPRGGSVSTSEHSDVKKKGKSVPDTWFSLSAHLTH